MFVLHPKRHDLVIAVKHAVDAYAAFGDLEGREFGRCVREQAERGGGYDDEEAEERVLKNNTQCRAAHGDNAERPKPIGAALDEFVLIRAPAQYPLLRRHDS